MNDKQIEAAIDAVVGEGTKYDLEPGTKVSFTAPLPGPEGRDTDIVGSLGTIVKKMSDTGYPGTGSDWYIVRVGDMDVEAQRNTHFHS